jgi:hypothetical protein
MIPELIQYPQKERFNYSEFLDSFFPHVKSEVDTNQDSDVRDSLLRVLNNVSQHRQSSPVPESMLDAEEQE